MSGADGQREKARLLDILDARAGAGAPVRFWWRDDDAVKPTPELERLLDVRRHYGVPLALAVIPAIATAALAERLKGEADVTVLQHGWRHEQHAPADVKTAEFGDHRPLPEMLAELRAGRAAMERLFPERFLPVLVPPWNRLGNRVRARRAEVGLPGLSAFKTASAGEAHSADPELDLIAWKTTRSALSRAEAFTTLAAAIEAAPPDKPIGILTHHLDHDEAVWALLDELLAALARHRAAWPAVASVFRLEAPG